MKSEIAGIRAIRSQLLGLRSRLERELASARSVRPLQGARIERLVADLISTSREIDAMLESMGTAGFAA